MASHRSLNMLGQEACPCIYACHVCDSQSLDAGDDGVEGGLNIGSGAGGHYGLGLFMEQLGYVLHRNTHESVAMSSWRNGSTLCYWRNDVGRCWKCG